MRAYFFFSDARHSPLARLCRPGFQHVLAVIETDGGFFAIDPLRGRVDLQFTNEVPLKDIVAKLREGRTALMIRHDPYLNSNARITRAPAITCASYLAYTLGIPFFGVTPYQLYKTLKARGAQEL